MRYGAVLDNNVCMAIDKWVLGIVSSPDPTLYGQKGSGDFEPFAWLGQLWMCMPVSQIFSTPRKFGTPIPRKYGIPLGNLPPPIFSKYTNVRRLGRFGIPTRGVGRVLKVGRLWVCQWVGPIIIRLSRYMPM